MKESPNKLGRAVSMKNDEMTFKQKKAFTIWVNQHLQKYNLKVEDLQNDFQDGTILYQLICDLSKRPPIKYKAPNNKIAKINVLNLSFDILAKEAIKIVNISSEDIYDSQLKLILGLVWTLILHYQIGALTKMIEEAGSSGKPASTEEVIKNSIKRFLELDAKDEIDLNKDFKDGRLLCGVVQSKVKNPSLDYKKLKTENAEANIQLAFHLADECLSVPPMLEVPELMDSTFDKKVLLTYLSSILTAPEVKPLEEDEKYKKLLDAALDFVDEPVIEVAEPVEPVHQQPKEESRYVVEEIQSLPKEELAEKNLQVSEPALVIPPKEEFNIQVSVKEVEEKVRSEYQNDDLETLVDSLVEPFLVEAQKKEPFNSIEKEDINFKMKEDLQKTADKYEKTVRMMYDNASSTTWLDQNKTAIVDAADFKYGAAIQKGENSIIIMNINTLLPPGQIDIKLLLNNCEKQSEELRLDARVLEKGFIEAQLRNVKPGFYNAKILIDNGVKYALSKNIEVVKDYQPNIQVVILQEDMYENYPVSLLIDTSDFECMELNLELDKNIEKENVVYRICERIFLYCFIPRSHGDYQLCFKEKEEKIKIAPLQFNIKPLTHSVYPFYHPSFLSVYKNTSSVICPLSCCTNMILFNYGRDFQILESDELYSNIVSGNNMSNQTLSWALCDSVYATHTKHLGDGLYVLETQIFRRSNNSINSNIIALWVQTDSLKTGVESTLYFDKNYSIESVKQICQDEVSEVEIPFKNATIERNGKKIQKLTLVPSVPGKLSIVATKDKSKQTSTCEFDIYDIKNFIQRVNVGETFSKAIKMEKSKVKNDLALVLTDQNFKNVKYILKTTDNGIQLRFSPTKSGELTCKVENTPLKYPNNIFKIQSHIENDRYFMPKKFCFFNCPKVSLDGAVIKEIFPSGRSTEKPLENSQDDDNLLLPYIYETDEEGYYSFIAKAPDSSEMIDYKTIYHSNQTTHRCELKPDTLLKLPKDCLDLSDIPNTCKCLLQDELESDYGQKEFPATINVNDDAQAEITFTPEKCGLYTLKVVKDSQNLLKKDVKIYVEDPDYTLTEVKDENNDIGNSQKDYFIHFKEIPSFKNLDDPLYKGMKVELFDDKESCKTLPVFKTRDDRLGFYLPKFMKAGLYKIKLISGYPSNEIAQSDLEAFNSNSVGAIRNAPIYGQEINHNDSFTNALDPSLKYQANINESKLSFSQPLKNMGIYLRHSSPNRLNKKIIYYVSPKGQLKSFSYIVKNPNVKSDVVPNISVKDMNDTSIPLEVEPINSDYCLIKFDGETDQKYTVQCNSEGQTIEPTATDKDEDKNLSDRVIPVNLPSNIDLSLNDKAGPKSDIENCTFLVCFKDKEVANVDYKLVSSNEKEAKFTVIPPNVGSYNFVLLNDKNEIVGTAVSTYYAINGYYPPLGKIYLKGKGAESANAYQPNYFDIVSQYPIEANRYKIKCKQNLLEFSKENVSPNKTRVTYHPDFIGDIHASIHIDDKELEQSPLKISVTDEKRPLNQKNLFQNYHCADLFVDDDLTEDPQKLQHKLHDDTGRSIDHIVFPDYYDSDKNLTKLNLVCFPVKPGKHEFCVKSQEPEGKPEHKTQFVIPPWKLSYPEPKVFGFKEKLAVNEKSQLFISEDPSSKDKQYKLKTNDVDNPDIITERVSDNLKSITWTPTSTGDYKIEPHVEKNTSIYPVADFPKTATVVRKNKESMFDGFHVIGNGLFRGLMDYPNIFQIISEQYSTEEVKVSMKGKEEVEIKLSNEKHKNRCITTVTYYPKSVGNYEIHLTYKDQQICGSPIKLRVDKFLDSVLSACCSLSENVFLNSDGNCRFFVCCSQESWANLTVTITFEDGNTVRPVIDEIAQNLFSVTFRTLYNKSCKVEISDKGFNIKGSPFSLQLE